MSTYALLLQVQSQFKFEFNIRPTTELESGVIAYSSVGGPVNDLLAIYMTNGILNVALDFGINLAIGKTWSSVLIPIHTSIHQAPVGWGGGSLEQEHAQCDLATVVAAYPA